MLFKQEYEYSETDAISGVGKRSVTNFEPTAAEKTLSDYNSIVQIVNNYAVGHTTMQNLEEMYLFIIDRPVESIKFFLRYFLSTHFQGTSDIATSSQPKCDVKNLFKDLYERRETFLRETRLERKINRERFLNRLGPSAECNPSTPTSISSVVASPTPTPQTQAKSLLRTVVDKTLGLMRGGVNPTLNDNLQVGASPFLKTNTIDNPSLPPPPPPPTITPRKRLTFTVSPLRIQKRTLANLDRIKN